MIGPYDPQALYRLRDAAGRLVYIGIANDVAQRLRQHARTAPWWTRAATCTTQRYPDRYTVLAAERIAIHDEQPPANQVRFPRPGDRRWLARSVTAPEAHHPMPARRWFQ